MQPLSFRSPDAFSATFRVGLSVQRRRPIGAGGEVVRTFTPASSRASNKSVRAFSLPARRARRYPARATSLATRAAQAARESSSSSGKPPAIATLAFSSGTAHPGYSHRAAAAASALSERATT